MKLPRRQFLHLVAGAAAMPAVSRIARAQTVADVPRVVRVGYPPFVKACFRACQGQGELPVTAAEELWRS